MLSKYIFIFFISFYSFSQNLNQVYMSYQLKERYHTLTIQKDSIVLYIGDKQKGLGTLGGAKYIYYYQERKDTLYFKEGKLLEMYTEESYLTKDVYQLVRDFNNARLKKVSNNELLLLGKNRPYYKKEYLEHILGDNYRFRCKKLYINGELIKDKNLDSIIRNINQENKVKKIFTKEIKGKKAYDKYGVEGLFGVLEIYCTTKK